MKKTLITLVLSTFLLSMPVASEGRSTEPFDDEIQAVSTPVPSTAPAFLQSIGIGRRRTYPRRRMVRRRMRVRRAVRRRVRRRVMHRRVIRHRIVRRTVRRRRALGIRIRPRIPRAIGIGVRRGRRH